MGGHGGVILWQIGRRDPGAKTRALFSLLARAINAMTENRAAFSELARRAAVLGH
jgi:hypothetical protein